MRHKSLDDYLLALMALAALVSLYMLYGQRFWKSSNDQTDKVASIVEQFKTVKRKRDFYQGWVDVGQGDVLSSNDEIYTHGQSSAKIHFEDGPEINLYENSLLKIKSVKGQSPSLLLQKGNLNARLNEKASTLHLEMGNKTYTFESKKADIQVEQGKNENKFLVSEGSAQLKQGDQVTDIQPNQVVIENKKEGKLEVKKLSFKEISPKKNESFYFGDGLQVPFKWQTLIPAAKGKVLIAEDQEFKKIISDFSIEGNEHSLTMNGEGTYYWKIESNDGLSGAIRSFSLIKEKPFILNVDKTVVYRSPQSSGNVFISWETPQSVLIKTTEPNGNIIEKKLTGKSFDWSPKQNGTYQIAVKINEKKRPFALWSEPVNISVIEEKAVEIKPLMNETIELVNYGPWPYKQHFNWYGPADNFNYSISLATNKQTKKIQTQIPSATVDITEAGVYSWIIQGKSPSGIPTNQIKGQLNIKAPIAMKTLPSAGAIIELERPDQLVKFEWKESAQSSQTSYQFELSSDENFKEIVKDEELKSASLSTVIGKTGTYFWRVKIKGQKGDEFSRPISVEVRPSPPLQAPQHVPDLNLKLKYQTPPQAPQSSVQKILDFFLSNAYAEDPVASAEWDLPANSRAKEYVVELYSDKEKENLVKRFVVTTPKVIWESAKPGTYYWQVAYVDYWSRQTEFSKLSTLVINEDEEAQKEASLSIELDRPKHKEEILEKAEDSFDMEWDYDGPSPVTLTIARDLEFTDIVFTTKPKKNEFEIKCSHLKQKEGNYYWKVQAGKISSKRRQFTVTCKVKPQPVVPPSQPKVEDKKETKLQGFEPLKRFFQAGLRPHQLTYENKSTDYSAKVDGTVLNSFFANYNNQVDLWWFNNYAVDFNLSRGKVFEEITFNDFDLGFIFKHRYETFSVGASIGMLKRTLYVESGSKIAASSFTSPLLGFNVSGDGEFFNGAIDVKAGSALMIKAELTYKFINRYFAGPFFEMNYMDKDNGKHNFSMIGLKLGANFPFGQ